MHIDVDAGEALDRDLVVAVDLDRVRLDASVFHAYHYGGSYTATRRGCPHMPSQCIGKKSSRCMSVKP